jgi:hypothetical protein
MVTKPGYIDPCWDAWNMAKHRINNGATYTFAYRLFKRVKKEGMEGGGIKARVIYKGFITLYLYFIIFF